MSRTTSIFVNPTKRASVHTNALLTPRGGWAVAAVRARRTSAAASAAPLALLIWGSAGAHAADRISLGTNAGVYAPQIVVDSIGDGYTSWADASSAETLHSCRLAPHARRCEAPQSFPTPAGPLDDIGNAPVFLADGELGVLDARDNGSSTMKELLTSADHGTTFTAPTQIVDDAASGAMDYGGDLLDLPAGFGGTGSTEELLTSDGSAATDGGSIQATGLTAPVADPGWYTPPNSGTYSENIAISRGTLIAVFMTATANGYAVDWVRYRGGDLNAASSWTAPASTGPAARYNTVTQLAGGPAGIFLARNDDTSRVDEVVVQRFTGSGWSAPVSVVNADRGGTQFSITETPTGKVYVIWSSFEGPLEYRVARNRNATRFGPSITVHTGGPAVHPEIAVNAEGAGWVTWNDEDTPSHAFAVAIVPAPRITRSGSVALATPRECVAVGGRFPVSVAIGHAHVTGVRFTIGSVTASGSSGHATLTLRSASSTTVVATYGIVGAHHHVRHERISAHITACF